MLYEFNRTINTWTNRPARRTGLAARNLRHFDGREIASPASKKGAPLGRP
jgi:hypothetical protein